MTSSYLNKYDIIMTKEGHDITFLFIDYDLNISF